MRSSFGFLGGAHPYFPPRFNGKGPNTAILRGLERVIEKEYLTDAFAREAVDYIDKHQEEQFFLYLTFNAVHTPMQSAEKYLARFPDVKDERRRNYCGMMSAMDDAIGSVLKKLDECGVTRDTLIFFVSDNGGPPVNASSNGPLRGNKAQTWEGGIRVPYLVQWKGKLPAGKTYDQPVIQLDLHSTALAAAGLVQAVKEQTGPPLDGVDLLPHLMGEVTTPPHDALYWRFGEQTAIRSGNHKLVKARGGSGDWELYDLAADLGETKNLAADKPDLANDLLAKYDAWNSSNIKPLWGAPAGGGKGKAGLKKLLEKEE